MCYHNSPNGLHKIIRLCNLRVDFQQMLIQQPRFVHHWCKSWFYINQKKTKSHIDKILKVQHITRFNTSVGHVLQGLLVSRLTIKSVIFAGHWWNAIDIYSALLILMAWCFSARPSVTTALICTHVSSGLWVKQELLCYHKPSKKSK